MLLTHLKPELAKLKIITKASYNSTIISTVNLIVILFFNQHNNSELVKYNKPFAPTTISFLPTFLMLLFITNTLVNNYIMREHLLASDINSDK